MSIRTHLDRARSALGWGCYHLKIRYERNMHFDIVRNPYRLISVDPADIDCMQLESEYTDWNSHEKRPADVHDLFDMDRAGFVPLRNVGRVLPGDWDERTKPIEQNLIYHSLKSHFEQNVPWEDTELVRICLARIDRGYESYGYSTREGFLNGRIPAIEQVYESMAESGYLTQNEVPDDNRTKDALHEVGVNIGRNGSLTFNNLDGNNRLTIARILGLEEIRASVIIRHQRWQALRAEVKQADRRSELSERAKTHLSHPDIRYLI